MKLPRSTRNKRFKYLKYRASHEAVAPYFADSYNTLLSIVQGVVLGALTYNFFTYEKITQLIIAKSIVSFGVICITWHRYIVHTQYVAWRLSFVDTLIPMFLAPLQFWLIWTIPKTIFDFSLAFLFTTILGLLAYINAFRNSKAPELKKIIKEHFANKSFADVFLAVLLEFEKGTIYYMSTIVIINVIVVVFNYCSVILSETQKTYVSTGIYTSMLFFLIKYNLRYFLKKSKELKKYKYEW